MFQSRLAPSRLFMLLYERRSREKLDWTHWTPKKTDFWESLVSECRVQKYADKGGLHCPLNFTQFTHLYMTGFTWVNKIQDNESTACD